MRGLEGVLSLKGMPYAYDIVWSGGMAHIRAAQSASKEKVTVWSQELTAVRASFKGDNKSEPVKALGPHLRNPVWRQDREDGHGLPLGCGRLRPVSSASQGRR